MSRAILFLAKLKRLLKNAIFGGSKAMKEATYQKMDKNEVLDKIFSFLVRSGLENISIRDLCRGTGIVQGSLYYWFSDKTSIICEATEYGLKKVTDEIFAYVFDNIDDLPTFFSECIGRISKYRNALRFIYQMAASPVYGTKIRSDGKYFKNMYDSYAVRLAEIMGCELEKLRPLVYLFISAICDYAIWADEQNTQTELDFIYSILPQTIGESAEGKF